MEGLALIQQWNRRYINMYWLSAVVGVFVFLIHIQLLPPGSRAASVVPVVVVPGVELFLIVGLLELLSRRFHRQLPYLVNIGGYAGVFIASKALYPFATGFVLVGLPFLFSLVYLRKRIIAVSFGLSLITFVVEFLTLYLPGGILHVGDAIIMCAYLGLSAVIGFQVVLRGQAVVQRLVRNIETGQELLVENAWMQRLTKVDALTELYNRSAFTDHLERLVEVAQTYDIEIHLAILDVDDFKVINDTYGHDVGDVVLQELAGYLKTETMPDYFVARYGGEEFVIVATDCSLAEFTNHMNQLRTGIEDATFADKSITVSIGVHTYTRAQTSEALFRGADRSLYISKEHGKNRLTVNSHEVTFGDRSERANEQWTKRDAKSSQQTP